MTNTTVLEEKIRELREEMYPVIVVDCNKDNRKGVNSEEDGNAANEKKKALDGVVFS